jgi:hypothetical protein
MKALDRLEGSYTGAILLFCATAVFTIIWIGFNAIYPVLHAAGTRSFISRAIIHTRPCLFPHSRSQVRLSCTPCPYGSSSECGEPRLRWSRP